MTPAFRRPDGSSEKIIALKNAGALPLWGRRVPYRVIWRWTKWGVRGVRLECRRLGGSVETSVEACERFYARTNDWHERGGSKR